jgi:hypothetical protein
MKLYKEKQQKLTNMHVHAHLHEVLKYYNVCHKEIQYTCTYN